MNDGLMSLEGVSNRDAINSLVSAKSLDKLLASIDNLPPLIPSEADGARVLRVRNVAGRINKKFLESDLDVLLDESAYYSNRAVRANERGAKIAVNARDAIGGGLEAELTQVIDLGKEDSYRVFVEPLLDWCFARNCAGLILRLFAALHAGDGRDALGTVGFELVKNKSLKTDIWTIPLAFNPFFAPRTKPGRDQLKEHSPLLFNATARCEDSDTRIPRWKVGDGEAYLLTSSDVNDTRRQMFGALDKSESHDERVLNLCVEDSGGKDEGALARQILNAFWYMARDLRFRESKNGPSAELGWKIEQEGIFNEVPGITIQPLSGFSRLLYQSYYRGTQRLAVCRNCGCATLQLNHGRKKEFCSDACRAQWVSEGKGSE